MKNKSRFIQILFFLGAIVITLSIFSYSLCLSPKANRSNSLVTEINNSKFDNADEQKNAKIVVTVIQILTRDMQLAQLAQKKGGLIDIRELGRINEKFNTNKLISAINLANNKSISIPTSTTPETEEIFMKLASLSNTSFDKEYCDLMIKNQLLTIDLLEKTISVSSDTDLINWSKQAIPELKNQLSNAIMCQKIADR